jgi:hypothetical protein
MKIKMIYDVLLVIQSPIMIFKFVALLKFKQFSRISYCILMRI